MIVAKKTDARERNLDQAAPPKRRMTEAEFVDWCTSKTWAEWIDGEVILMSPVNLSHARLTAFFLRLIGDFAEETGAGEVFSEPYQIRFAQLRRRRSPDVIFVSASRLHLLHKHALEGAPDLIVEVVSPGSRRRDYREKLDEYERAGVKEYWLVDPSVEEVEVYALNKRKEFEFVGQKDGMIRSVALPKFFIKPEWLWRARLPKVSELLKQMLSKR